MGFSKKKEKTEDFVLELITSIIETKKPKPTIEAVIALANKKGDHDIASQLYEVLTLIEDGRTFIESFYYANMLTEDTYSLFKLADAKNALTREIIEERVEDREAMKKIDSAMMSSLIQPFVLIFLASMASVFIMTRIIPILVSFYKDEPIPLILEPYILINASPILGFFALVAFMFGFMGAVMALVRNKTGKTEMTLYKISTVVKILKDIGLSYEQIFTQMSEIEVDQKLSEMYVVIYNEISISSITEALNPLLEKMPIGVAVVLADKISRNDDLKGWTYVKAQMKHQTFMKIDGFSKMLPFLSYIFIFTLMIIAMLPMGLLTQKAMSLAG
jgi:hypothetical protein